MNPTLEQPPHVPLFTRRLVIQLTLLIAFYVYVAVDFVVPAYRTYMAVYRTEPEQQIDQPQPVQDARKN